MTRSRVVLVAKSYWPHLSATARACERLALALHACGCEVQILTAQLPRAPLGLFHDGPIRVTRLPHGAANWWGTMRFWIALADWLRSHRADYDLVCVSGLRYDAFSASQALAGEVQPLVLRAEAAGMGGDCHWQETARFGSRIRARCQQATAIIATGSAVEAELIQADYDPQQVSVIPNAVEEMPLRSEESRLAARATLADTHASLRAEDSAPIALCVDPILATEQLPALLTFWKQVVHQTPSARLWIVGQGRAYSIIPRLAEKQQLELSVAVPGMFDSLAEFYDAADMLLLPFDTGGSSVVALEAMARGLPVVARDTPANQLLLDSGRRGWLFPLENAEAIKQVVQLLSSTETYREELESRRLDVQREHSLQRMGESHCELFDRLLATQSLQQERAT